MRPMATRSLKARIPVAPLSSTASTASWPVSKSEPPSSMRDFHLRVAGLEGFQALQAKAVGRAAGRSGQERQAGMAQLHEVSGEVLDALPVVHHQAGDLQRPWWSG